MKRFFLFFFASLCAVIPVCSQVNVLERCTPESQGVPSEKITALQLYSLVETFFVR